MSRPDKATLERHSRTLKELVKRPENRICADCKRNDPRWASWNLGVFVCIRCSGIHRSMGTHISKVKSVDLDVWTAEQMESIQRWGNRRANIYWEAHLKPGHNPPEQYVSMISIDSNYSMKDSKIESFIRSKYESRRWAMEGPPPSDPATLEQGTEAQQSAPVAQTQAAPAPISTPTHAQSASRSSTGRQPQQHQLLSSAYTRTAGAVPALASPAVAPPPVQSQPAAQPPQSTQGDLFSLDFHAPPAYATSQQQQEQPKKDVKQDIMSLFSATPATTPATAGFGNAGFGQFSAPSTAAWGGFPAQAQPQVQQQQTSMIGNGGVGAWGASSGWNAAPIAPPNQPNVWATPGNPSQSQSALFNTSDIWGSSSTTTTASAAPAAAAPAKKDDVFGDLWGGFK
ncbi:ArfGap-domain-containing protein [Coprinopsis marcescibilis]|uniref:ArfGap-domain-containing protein n=1 Tax=Coprinopsis marcescibilis TaxID=230819 RepID=A0A5C3KNV2_COPMA|nr:ArfGap-domain-containing protein [Coprinopsis marcescibilis]